MCFLFYSEWMRRHTFSLQICNPCTFSDSDQHVPSVFRHAQLMGALVHVSCHRVGGVLGVFGWEALNIDGTTSYYWQSGSKWESTVFCCGGCDPSTCLPLYLTCRTEFVTDSVFCWQGVVVALFRFHKGTKTIIYAMESVQSESSASSLPPSKTN